jgi:hypothetical protein
LSLAGTYPQRPILAKEGAAGVGENLGEQTEPQHRQALPPLELRRRIEQLLDRLDRPDGLGDWLRRTRAFAVLEQMDLREAGQLLKTLAAGAAWRRTTYQLSVLQLLTKNSLAVTTALGIRCGVG